ncbi:MAG: hypothetical protein IJK18_06415 [Clostridia bacterium]|nr:hypothetical protein [Clostridia bacterium]
MNYDDSGNYKKNNGSFIKKVQLNSNNLEFKRKEFMAKLKKNPELLKFFSYEKLKIIDKYFQDEKK